MNPKDEDIYDMLDRYGIEDPSCGAENLPGWHGIIDDLIKDIIVLGWDKRLSQIKEKFGGLRFYPEGTTDAIHERIYAAERDSFRYCQFCGEPGRLRRGGWLLTLCDSCAVANGRGEGQGGSGMGDASGPT